MLCELWALLSRVLGPKPKSTAGLGHTGDGVCTMDPDIGRWVCQCFGMDMDSKNTKVTLKLDDLAGMLWKRTFLEEEPRGRAKCFEVVSKSVRTRFLHGF